MRESDKLVCPFCGSDSWDYYQHPSMPRNGLVLFAGERSDDYRCRKCDKVWRRTCNISLVSVADVTSEYEVDRESEDDIAAYRAARKAVKGEL